MSRFSKQAVGVPSILDRLVDANPDSAKEPVDDFGVPIEQIRRNVARDLGDLLNTRVSWMVTPEKFERVQESILNYGVPDLNNVVLDSRRSVDWLAEKITEAIQRFDKRLSQVRVVVERIHVETHELKFRIDAVLSIAQEPIAIQFDPTLDMVRREFRFDRKQSARRA